jgi:hypothetical protein
MSSGTNLAPQVAIYRLPVSTTGPPHYPQILTSWLVRRPGLLSYRFDYFTGVIFAAKSW